SIEKAMERELREEVGIIPRSFEKKALFEFHFKDKPEYLEVHVFYISSFDGEPKETEEMRPQWFSVEEIPFESMWPDDKHWFPLFLEGKNFSGKFLFLDHDTILEYTLE
ncbi:NUDIX domain-containing protein, partial [Patescibacteria group bacterium]|nr:NUDIX domain-containing protein [Patescibacteria group bacterium]